MNQSADHQRIARIDSDFKSWGTRCAGWLYQPAGMNRPPVVIMAHGFAGERTFGLPAFAERFARNGMAVFLFDYRNFGDSDGKPRNLVDPFRHCQDWEAALEHVRHLPDIDAERIALWGTSLSGGHVIVTAAHNPDVRAIVAQIPYVAPNMELFGFRDSLKAYCAAYRDLGRKLTGRDPYCVPVVGDIGTFAMLNTPECKEGYKSFIPGDSSWENRVPARLMFKTPFYTPMRLAKRVVCPALLIAAENDSLIPSETVKKVASRMLRGEFEQLPCNHFAPYQGEFFERIVQLETEFLCTHLETK